MARFEEQIREGNGRKMGRDDGLDGQLMQLVLHDNSGGTRRRGDREGLSSGNPNLH